MIHTIRKHLNVVGKHVDELPLEHQGNLFSTALSIVALVAIVRAVLS